MGPTVLVVSPKKARFAQYRGGFEAKKIGQFIGQVLSGKQRIAPLPGKAEVVPEIAEDEDCASIHAAMMPIEDGGDDVDMDDIMAEMAAEAEEKAAQDAADLEEAEAN